jgi:hypothetical protein
MVDEIEGVRRCPCEQCQWDPKCAVAREHRAINQVMVLLDERRQRLFAGLLASQLGHGGVMLLAKVTGLSRTTIRRGQVEIDQAAPGLGERIR